MNWTNNAPTNEGWYFWKRNRNWRTWLWQAIYITTDEGVECWEGGVNIRTPKGGWWKYIPND